MQKSSTKTVSELLSANTSLNPVFASLFAPGLIPLVSPELLKTCAHGVKRLDCYKCQAAMYRGER